MIDVGSNSRIWCVARLATQLGAKRSAATRIVSGLIAALVTTLALAAPPPNSAPLPNATATTTTTTTPPAEAAPPALSFPIPEALHPLDVHPRTSLSIVEQLRHNHYLQKPLDDAASSELFDKYIDLLDSGHAYFLASDIQALEKYRYTLDDALKRGDLDPAFDIFNRYQARLEERLEFLITELNQGLQTMNVRHQRDDRDRTQTCTVGGDHRGTRRSVAQAPEGRRARHEAERQTDSPKSRTC